MYGQIRIQTFISLGIIGDNLKGSMCVCVCLYFIYIFSNYPQWYQGCIYSHDIGQKYRSNLEKKSWFNQTGIRITYDGEASVPL